MEFMYTGAQRSLAVIIWVVPLTRPWTLFRSLLGAAEEILPSILFPYSLAEVDRLERDCILLKVPDHWDSWHRRRLNTCLATIVVYPSYAVECEHSGTPYVSLWGIAPSIIALPSLDHWSVDHTYPSSSTCAVFCKSQVPNAFLYSVFHDGSRCLHFQKERIQVRHHKLLMSLYVPQTKISSWPHTTIHRTNFLFGMELVSQFHLEYLPFPVPLSRWPWNSCLSTTVGLATGSMVLPFGGNGACGVQGLYQPRHHICSLHVVYRRGTFVPLLFAAFWRS